VNLFKYHAYHHQLDGWNKPYVEKTRWYTQWKVNGMLHRINGPANVTDDGDEGWYRDGKLHRDGDMPAVTNADQKMWYVNGKRHRDGGPQTQTYGAMSWFYQGIRLAEAWFEPDEGWTLEISPEWRVEEYSDQFAKMLVHKIWSEIVVQTPIETLNYPDRRLDQWFAELGVDVKVEPDGDNW
jgi:hypothetical protein